MSVISIPLYNSCRIVSSQLKSITIVTATNDSSDLQDPPSLTIGVVGAIAMATERAPQRECIKRYYGVIASTLEKAVKIQTYLLHRDFWAYTKRTGDGDQQAKLLVGMISGAEQALTKDSEQAAVILAEDYGGRQHQSPASRATFPPQNESLCSSLRLSCVSHRFPLR